MRDDGTGFHPTKDALTAIWFDLWKKYFEDVPPSPMAGVTRKILWDYWRKWTEVRDEGEFEDFLNWLFKNWHALGAGSFNWMSDFPKQPAVEMIISASLRSAFERAYRDKEQLKVFQKMEPHERKLKKLIEEDGLDPAKAREIIERQFVEVGQVKVLKEEYKKLAFAKENFRRERTAATARRAKRRKKKKTKPLKVTDWKDE